MQGTNNDGSSPHPCPTLYPALQALCTMHHTLQANSEYYKPVEWHRCIPRFQHILLKQVIEEKMHYSRNSVSFYRKKHHGMRFRFYFLLNKLVKTSNQFDLFMIQNLSVSIVPDTYYLQLITKYPQSYSIVYLLRHMGRKWYVCMADVIHRN